MEPTVELHVADSTPVRQIYRWRTGSKVVAYFELVAQTLLLLAVLVGSFILLVEEGHNLKVVFWVYLLVVILVLALGIWFSSLLLTATKTETSSKVALKKVKIWMRGVIVYIIFAVFTNIVTGDVILLFVVSIVRGGCMLIVGQFIGELYERAVAEGLPKLNMNIATHF